MSRFPAITLLAFFAATSSWATSSYPGHVKQSLGLERVPQCTLCHATNSGGAGTANSPFAVSMQAAGLSGGGDVAALEAALAQLEADATDSDMDGVPDITELKNGKNPNVADQQQPADGGTTDGGATGIDAGTPPPEIPEPAYGCSQSGSGLLGALAGFVALALFAMRRRSAI